MRGKSAQLHQDVDMEVSWSMEGALSVVDQVVTRRPPKRWAKRQSRSPMASRSCSRARREGFRSERGARRCSRRPASFSIAGRAPLGEEAAARSARAQLSAGWKRDRPRLEVLSDWLLLQCWKRSARRAADAHRAHRIGVSGTRKRFAGRAQLAIAGIVRRASSASADADPLCW